MTTGHIAPNAPATPMSAGQQVLQATGLTRRFGGLIAVNNVSFEVRRGEIFGLIGPNGAGKTTLFNLMTGLTPPSSGKLTYLGQDITGFAPHRVAALGIGRTFQNIRLFKILSALENVKIAQHARTDAGLLRGLTGRDRAEERFQLREGFREAIRITQRALKQVRLLTCRTCRCEFQNDGDDRRARAQSIEMRVQHSQQQVRITRRFSNTQDALMRGRASEAQLNTLGGGHEPTVRKLRTELVQHPPEDEQQRLQ